jgi:hypothetical protein
MLEGVNINNGMINGYHVGERILVGISISFGCKVGEIRKIVALMKVSLVNRNLHITLGTSPNKPLLSEQTVQGM